jgi:Protein of unknown function (DUF2384)
MRSNPRPAALSSDAKIVAKAALKAAERLRVQNKFLAKILGVSEATISRMRKGDYPLDRKPLELALLFVRLYRSLDAMVGGDDSVAAAWLHNKNSALKDLPIVLIQTVPGLIDVLQYLDARRAVV